MRDIARRKTAGKRESGRDFIERDRGTPPNNTDLNTVPPELKRAVFGQIWAAQASASPAPTAEQLAASLGRTEGSIKRACALLESEGLVRASQKAADHTNPRYTISGQAPAVAQEHEAGTRDRVVTNLLRATAKVFKSDLNLEVRLAGGEVRDDQATTEDFSVFVRVTGRFEGSICFGLSRSVALALVGIIARQRVASIDHRALRVLNSLVDRVVGLTRGELAVAGYAVDVSPASTVRPVGMRITTLGVQQVVATLETRHGPVVVHVVLRENPETEALAA